jgi:hypothetical protein
MGNQDGVLDFHNLISYLKTEQIFAGQRQNRVNMEPLMSQVPISPELERL